MYSPRRFVDGRRPRFVELDDLFLGVGDAVALSLGPDPHEHLDLASRTAWCRSTRATSKILMLRAPFTGVELVSADEGQNEVTRLAFTPPRGYDARPPKWDWQPEARVEDDGSIRLSPCVDAIACTRRNADVLTR